MLDAFIIEELRRREEQERSNLERPRLELPLEDDRDRVDERNSDDTGEKERGVIVIDV